MKTENTIAVGDKMLFVPDSGARFVECTVSKVNKRTFKAILTGDGKGTLLFRIDTSSFGLGDKRRVYHDMFAKLSNWNHKIPLMYSDTPDNREWLDDCFNKKETDKAEKSKRQEQEYEIRKTEENKKMRETKVAFGCDPDSNCLPFIRMQETMPDGQRVYCIQTAVHPNHIDRKNGWEMTIVRCKDIEKIDYSITWDGAGERPVKKMIEMVYTFTNGGSASFSSVSITSYHTEESAVWDALCSTYHSW